MPHKINEPLEKASKMKRPNRKGTMKRFVLSALLLLFLVLPQNSLHQLYSEALVERMALEESGNQEAALRVVSSNLRKQNSDHSEFLKRQKVIDELRQLYEQEEISNTTYLTEILTQSREMLSKLDTVYSIPLPEIGPEEHQQSSKKGITIVGDIHGGYYNILEIFKTNGGLPSKSRPYIFNGDFTDKGRHSLQCLLSLLIIKLYCNECLHLTRGNHETTRKIRKGRLHKDIVKHYDEEMSKLVESVLYQLPLGIIVDDRIFVCHGGIPNKGFDLKDLKAYKRQNRDPGKSGSEDGVNFMHSIWAHPKDENGTHTTTLHNYFGPDISEDFLKLNNLEYIVRGHTHNEVGWYKSHGDNVWTIHSDPHADGEFGTFLNVYSSDRSMVIEQFKQPWKEKEYALKMMDWRTLL